MSFPHYQPQNNDKNTDGFYISSLGVVSGMVGAGGNGGAVAMLNLFFKGHPIRKDKAILNMGLTIVILTCTMVMPVYMLSTAGCSSRQARSVATTRRSSS